MAFTCKHGKVAPCEKCDKDAMQEVKMKWDNAEKGWRDCSSALQKVADERDTLLDENKELLAALSDLLELHEDEPNRPAVAAARAAIAKATAKGK